ncbi:hypothetical protein EVJ30_08285 [Exiguobacterium sp. SH5S13]|uniref:hypothetical protein n=1 Tax=unclassified Exiguobacterium TaxID=2644629 RepID=UPI00103DB9C8|nr:MULTISPECIES: hypothetical protein [unclassified Exiguobacterium]TCI24327.1 hypothetical protein EVJ32_14560 [Exiguobacterium sp. SH5S4]TCI53433.1 hypothetical protein EVJ30_08285 [Exiguobacterium sp. SH5S13]
MTEFWSFEDSTYDAIRNYVTTDWNYAPDETIYILDNMLLSKLAKVAREHPSAFIEMADYFVEEQAVFLIPDIIFEESAKSKHTDSERYASWYLDFFKRMSQACKVIRIDFHTTYQIMIDGVTNIETGFSKFKLIAKETVRMNPDLSEQVNAATSVDEIKEAFYSVSKDCGERVVHLLACALLLNGAQSVTVLSDEEAGVFIVRQMYARNERLLQLLYMQDKYVFLSSYLLYSFDRLLYNVLIKRKQEDVLDFLNTVRDSRDQTRYVRIIFGDESDRSQLDNSQFTDMIFDDKAKITF